MRGPDLSLPPALPPAAAPGCPPPSLPSRGAAVSGSRAPVPLLRGLSSPRPGLRPPGRSSRMVKPLASPAPAALSAVAPGGPAAPSPPRSSSAGRDRRRAPSPAGPPCRRGGAGAAPSPPPSRPRGRGQSLPSHMLLTGWHLARRPRRGRVVRSLSPSRSWVGAPALRCLLYGKHRRKVGFPLTSRSRSGTEDTWA